MSLPNNSKKTLFARSANISVIVPIFNVEKFLPECLTSIANQSIKDIEIICVNDCSKDSSQQILDQYAAADARFVIEMHDVNRGLAAARNTGLDVATGEYIYFLDSDDIFPDDNALETLYDVAIEDDSDEVIGGVFRWYPDSGKKEMGWHSNYLQEEIRGKSLKELSQLKSNVVAWNKLIKRSLLNENNIRFNENIIKHEDNPFSCMVHMLADRISIIPRNTYLYRQGREDSLMSRQKKEDAYYKYLYCSEIYSFIESDRKYHVYRDMYYGMYTRQLVQGAQILSRYSPDEQEKSELLDCWASAISIMEEGYPGVSPPLQEIFTQVSGREYDLAWQKAIDWCNVAYPEKIRSNPKLSDGDGNKNIKLKNTAIVGESRASVSKVMKNRIFHLHKSALCFLMRLPGLNRTKIK